MILKWEKMGFDAANGRARVPEVGKQRHKHNIPNQGKPNRLQSWSLEGRIEEKLCQTL